MLSFSILFNNCAKSSY